MSYLPTGGVDSLPAPPHLSPAVQAAAALVEKATAELKRRREAFTAAQEVLAKQHEAAGERLLERIKAGAIEGEIDEPALTAATLPPGWVADAERAVHVAAARHAAALAEAREAFAAERRAHEALVNDWRPWRWGSAGSMAAVGVAAAIVLVLLPLRLLPGGLSDGLYALVTGQDRWQAGTMMMYRAGPEAFGAIKAADTLLQRAGKDIEACLKVAEKAGKPQKCSFTVGPPVVAEAKN